MLRYGYILLLLLLGCAADDGSPAHTAISGAERGITGDTLRLRTIRGAMEQVRPLATLLGPPRPGEWRADYHEPEETFEDYLTADPTLPTPARRTIHIRILGSLTPVQRRVVPVLGEYIGRYFGLPVVIDSSIILTSIPATARRRHPTWGVRQILSTYLMDSVLAPRLPADATAMLGITGSDLWPGDSMNFVFGEGSFRHRVGVWSLYRLGETEGSPLLARTLKIATHELGHMFSIPHCGRYECIMNGSNSLEETDRHPLHLCPECMAKLCWATKYDPADRYRTLIEFCNAHELTDERDFLKRSLAKIRSF